MPTRIISSGDNDKIMQNTDAVRDIATIIFVEILVSIPAFSLTRYKEKMTQSAAVTVSKNLSDNADTSLLLTKIPISSKIQKTGTIAKKCGLIF